MNDLQNPNLASDSNTLCGFQQVSTPFCFCLPMAKMFICSAGFQGQFIIQHITENSAFLQ